MTKLSGKFVITAAAFAILAAGSAQAGTFDLRQSDASASYVNVAVATDSGAEKFISSMGDRGINFLGDQTMTIEAKKAEFAKLLNQSFDMNTIGRFSLGSYWKNATPAQQKEYLSLFNTMIIKVYSKRFSDYKGQKFEVRSSRKDNDKDATVTSYIVPPSGPEVRVDWRVRNKDGNYKVVDIIVEGVSMAMTQRSDFSSVIQRGGGKIEVLLEHLRKQ